MSLITKRDFLKISILLLIIAFGMYLRYRLLDESGGDLPVMRRAVTDILDHKNPYEITVGTFRKDRPYVGTGSGLDHGYAYMPTLLYIYTPLYLAHLHFHIPLQRIWKLVTIIAELGVSIFFILKFYKKDFDILVISLIVWLFNPYLIARNSYTYSDPIGILFMLLALNQVGKSDVKTGIYYALSVSFKAFPLILLPFFILKSRYKIKFLISGFLTALALSSPFLLSKREFLLFFKGSFLVHSQREIQGRPFLASISYLFNLKIYTPLTTSILIYLATFSGWVYTISVYLKKKTSNIYSITLICFGLLFLFTPIFTRTYVLWLLPIYILALHEKFQKKKVYFYALIFIFYLFFGLYLKIWDQGFTLRNGILLVE